MRRPRSVDRRDLRRFTPARLARATRGILGRFTPGLFVAYLSPTTAELGLCGEELAARALRRKGWRLLGRRVKTPFGEVDIVAEHGGRLVCVEVKAGRVPSFPRLGRSGSGERVGRCGPSDPGMASFRPGHRLDHRRLARQRRAGHYLARHLAEGRLPGGRVDLVEVAFRGRSRRIELVHHEDVRAPVARQRVDP